VNYPSITYKGKFQLLVKIAVVTIFTSQLHFLHAQPPTIIKADQGSIPEIIVASEGSIRSNGPGLVRMDAPEYPARAQQRNITGWSLVQFSVDEDGSVAEDSVIVVDSEPAGIFDEASINAAYTLFFGPKIVDGVEVAVEGMQYVFRYVGRDNIAVARLPGTVTRDYLPLNFITPRYPDEAKNEGIEGFVLVEFTITAKGLPTGIVILDRSPSDIFNESAVNAAERLRFNPRTVNGSPVEAVGAQQLFTFNSDD